MAVKSFNECLDTVHNFIPKNLQQVEEFEALTKLLAYALQKNYEELNRLDNAYNVDFVDIRELPKLADTIGIIYPVGASADILRLLLKYYGKIIKNRGNINSIKQMVRFLEFSEQDIFEMSLEDYSSVEVNLEYKGFLIIKCDGVSNFDYAYRMLRKVVPAGYRFEVMNRTGPYNRGFEQYLFNESATVEEI